MRTASTKQIQALDEKAIKDYGIEPEEFKEIELLAEYETFKSDKTTEGIFAPWAIYKSDFQAIGGHDELFPSNPFPLSILFS